MLNINSYKCTIMLLVLFVLLAVGEAAAVGAIKGGSFYWQMLVMIIAPLTGVLRNGATVLFAGVLVWHCARKTITFPAMCNVIIVSVLTLELLILVELVKVALRYSFR